MVPFLSTRYVGTFGVFDVNRAIYPCSSMGSGMVAVAQLGAGEISGLSVDFIGPTT